MKRTGWFLVVLSVGWMVFQPLEAQAQGLSLLNDHFSDAILLEGFPVTNAVNNVEATLEENEESIIQGTASVWFSWVATFDGPVMIQLSEYGAFDPILEVGTGDSLETLEILEVEFNQYQPEMRVLMEVSLGTTYRIVVSGRNESTGEATLKITEDPTATISGRVLGPDGMTPLEGIEVSAWYWDDYYKGWEWILSDYTDSNGDYALRGLDPDTYRVLFTDWAEENPYLEEAYHNQPDVDSATDITVVAFEHREGIDASLSSSGPPAAPVIVDLKRVGSSDEWEIRFVGLVDETYVLQETESMSHSFTDVVGSETVCQPATNSFFRESSSSARFWRVRMVDPL